MTYGEVLSTSSSNRVHLKRLSNQRVVRPFKERSNSQQNFRLDTVGPIVTPAYVQASLASSSTNVLLAETCMQQLHADSSKIKNLPTPVRASKLDNLLTGYDHNLREHLVKWFYLWF